MACVAHNRARPLPRKFGAWTGAAVVIGVIIGSGIFRVPGPIAAQAGTVTGLALVWVLGGLIALTGALSVAELAAMYPQAGGPYVYLREAYGRPLAFLFGWMWLITTPISWAAQSLTFADYLASLTPLSRPAAHFVAAGLITLVCAAQYRSVRLGALVQNLSTTAKILAILGLSLALLAFAPHGPVAAFAAGSQAVHAGGVAIALVAVLWAYDGWENLTTLSGEIRAPQTSLPRALIGGTLAVIVLYLAINAAFVAVLPFAQLAHSQSVAVDAMVALFGRGGATLVAVLVMVSVIGSLNGSTLSDPRVFYAMAEDGLFFKAVGRVHARYETPYVAILFCWALGVIYVLFRDFLELAESYVLGIWPFLALSVIGLFVLRRRDPDRPRPYRALGYPLVPALFVLATVGVVAYSLYKNPLSTGLSLGFTLAGLPLYYAWTLWQRRTRKLSGDAAHI